MKNLVIVFFLVFTVVEGRTIEETESGGIAILDPSGKAYFPESSGSSNVAKNLAALKEPSLYALEGKADVNVFRFTWIPTNQKTISFRAYQTLNKGCYIDVKRLSGAGGYYIGEIELSAEVRISDGEFNSMRDLAKKDSVRDPFKTLKPEVADILTTTGQNWIVEVVTGGKYYFAQVGDPEFLQTVTPENAKKAGVEWTGEPFEVPPLEPFIHFCEHFLAFTDMKLPTRSVSGMDWIFDGGNGAKGSQFGQE